MRRITENGENLRYIWNLTIDFNFSITSVRIGNIEKHVRVR